MADPREPTDVALCHLRPDRRTFSTRVFLLAAFLAPLSYVASISSVATHEVLGHGCTALMTGGTFTGFTILPDGMGWAQCESHDHPLVVFAAGIVVEVVAGLVFLLVALVLSSPLARLALLVFSIMAFTDGLSYGFWNTLFACPPGDMGRILSAAPLDGTGQHGLTLAFAVAWLAATFGVLLLIWRCLEQFLGSLTRVRAITASTLFLGIPGVVYWSTFDWNQLIEGVGALPSVCGACLQIAVCLWLVWMQRRQVTLVTVDRRTWIAALATSWMACAGLLAVLLGWLRHGVTL